jgi:phage gp36-like protein
MAYCEQSDIEKLIPEQELAELTADTGSTPDAEVVAEAIAKADAEIDSYLGVVYTVPLSVPPSRVRSLSEDFAIYYLYQRRSVVPEARQKAYDDGIAFLKLLVAGKAVLPPADTGETVTGSSHTPQFSSATSIFNRDNMTSW